MSRVPEGPDPRRWKAHGLICTAVFMTVLDIAIVNVALRSIGGAIGTAVIEQFEEARTPA